MARETRNTGFSVENAQMKYCIQNILFQMAGCPIFMNTPLLLERGLSASLIGVTGALGNLLSIAIQPAIASAADKKNGPDLHKIILVLSTIATVCCGINYFVRGGIPTMLFIVTILMVEQNVMSLINGVSVFYENRGAQMNYGLARGMGSASFAIMSALIGFAIDGFGANIIALLGCIISAIATASVLLLPTPKSVPPIQEIKTGASAEMHKEQGDGSYLGFLTHNPGFMMLIVGMSLMFILGSAVFAYAIQIVEGVGGTNSDMGLMIAIQAIVEVPVMFGYLALERRFGTKPIMAFVMISYVIRAAVYLFAGNIPMLYVGYAMQMTTFGLYMPASVSFGNRYFTERDKNKALGLLAMVNPIGSTIGSLVNGFLVDNFGVRVMLVVALVFAIVGCVVGLRGLAATKLQGVED